MWKRRAGISGLFRRFLFLVFDSCLLALAVNNRLQRARYSCELLSFGAELTANDSFCEFCRSPEARSCEMMGESYREYTRNIRLLFIWSAWIPHSSKMMDDQEFQNGKNVPKLSHIGIQYLSNQRRPAFRTKSLSPSRLDSLSNLQLSACLYSLH